ncbi:NAD(P)-dependent oxidoreductase [Actinomadura sp. NTSP31]|uniref:NAD(P)-dependent oxidoreductase n=1 Tax=Actinomadura sp. NTSP31 TaxID=1735447 RepID=UPI0035BEE976
MSGRGGAAVLGTGAMGSGIAVRLAEAGRAVRTWNRTAGRADVGHPGAEPCETPEKALAGADHVLLVLSDDRALREVVGVVAGAVAGADRPPLVLALGTVASATVRDLASRVPLLDVGMLGNPAHARTGDLRLYVGGDADRVEQARPLLDDLGKDVRHVGPLGAGMDLKLALNLLMGLEMQALAEAAALAGRLGLDRRTVLEIIGGSGFASPVMRFKGARMAAGRYGDPDFRLALMTKDLGLAAAAADAAGPPLPMTGAALRSHEAACADGWGDHDCAAIAAALDAGGPGDH